MIDAGILPGDYVIVHRRSTAENGEIVIALLEDEATCKRVHWEAASGSRRRRRLWLMPENEEYQPIDGTCARILGKVVAVIRSTADGAGKKRREAYEKTVFDPARAD